MRSTAVAKARAPSSPTLISSFRNPPAGPASCMDEMARPSSWSEAARQTPSMSARPSPASARAAALASKTSSVRLSASGDGHRAKPIPWIETVGRAPAAPGLGQVPLLGDVDHDQGPLLEGQPDMEPDQRLEGRAVLARPVGAHLGGDRLEDGGEASGQPVEQGDEDGILVLEVPVDGRPGDPGGGGDVVDAGAVETVLLEQRDGRGQDALPPLAPCRAYPAHAVSLLRQQ